MPLGSERPEALRLCHRQRGQGHADCAPLARKEDRDDGGADGGYLRVRPGDVPLHRSTRRLAPVDAVCEQTLRQSGIVCLAAESAVH